MVANKATMVTHQGHNDCVPRLQLIQIKATTLANQSYVQWYSTYRLHSYIYVTIMHDGSTTKI